MFFFFYFYCYCNFTLISSYKRYNSLKLTNLWLIKPSGFEFTRQDLRECWQSQTAQNWLRQQSQRSQQQKTNIPPLVTSTLNSSNYNNFLTSPHLSGPNCGTNCGSTSNNYRSIQVHVQYISSSWNLKLTLTCWAYINSLPAVRVMLRLNMKNYFRPTISSIALLHCWCVYA